MKRYLLSLCAAFCLVMGVQAQNQMHVQLKDGSTMNVFVSEIEQITWDSFTDDQGDNNPDDPTVTGDATDITENSATIVGYANNVRDNESTDLQIGIIYCTEGTPNKSNGIQKTVNKSDVASDGKYTINLTNLGAGATYYYRSFMYQSGLWFYGKVRTFTTTGLLFSTDAATSITCFSAKVSAKINTPPTVIPSEYGICYGTSNEPTNRQRITTKADDGTVSATLRALEGNTVYYYRPYAVVNGVVSYGQTSSFKTLADNVVVTGEIDSEGNVRSRLTIGGGAYSSLEVGLCWSKTNAEPTVNDYTAKTNELDDENYYVITPDFYFGINYYRAYVKIDGVAHYGEVKSTGVSSDSNIFISGWSVILSNSAVEAGCESVTIDLNTLGFEDATDVTTVTFSDGTTATFGSGSNTINAPKFYTSTKGVRLYAHNTISFAGAKTIAKVVMTCDSYSGTDYVGNPTATASFDGKNATYVNYHTDTKGGTQLRVQTITITYTK